MEVRRKRGEELFKTSGDNTDLRLIDFWGWAYSDLMNNLTRGALAEFLVAADLDVHHEVRDAWAPFDLTDKEKTKIEVKSSAYLQSWSQHQLSEISFDIKPTLDWNGEAHAEPTRSSDVYVFCLYHHRAKQTADLMDLDQWVFYILPTETLNTRLGNQKRISLGRLIELSPTECKFGEIGKAIRTIKRRLLEDM